MSSKKYQFAQMVQTYCTLVAQAYDDGANARDIFNDRGYGPGGNDPIQDSDVEGLGITAANVTAAMVFFENLGLMLNNGSITQADYDATLNIMRADL